MEDLGSPPPSPRMGLGKSLQALALLWVVLSNNLVAKVEPGREGPNPVEKNLGNNKKDIYIYIYMCVCDSNIHISYIR